MNLREALSVLSKSSPYAVTTSGDVIDPVAKTIKDYLFVETDIERAFQSKIDNIKSNEIVFLCGSSGDGKSEIMTKYRLSYKGDIQFHLDATHSFEPNKTAIDTLNDVFTSHRSNDRALVVGINIGMLANFEREGNYNHRKIKQTIKHYLEHGNTDDNHITFLNFESFPKFKISDGKVNSEFFMALLDKVVRDDSKNYFRDLYNACHTSSDDKILAANFLLLRNKFVQKVIVELLLNMRIKKDQFITARMLLDFIYCILTGTGYLFDNLFNGGDNEILSALTDFDPSLIRNRELDLFILHRTLNFEDQNYDLFSNEVECKYRISKDQTPQSMIRLFYLLKHTTLDSNYHFYITKYFNEESQELYKNIWERHRKYSGNREEKKLLRQFYDDIVYAAINKYANRNAPYLSIDEFYISSHGGHDLATEVELNIVYKSIEQDKHKGLAYFNIYLEINNYPLNPIPMNVNLLELMMVIVGGYRPNKHDKNSIVLLDDLINKITSKASMSKVIHLYENGERIKLKENLDKEIRVSGL